MKKLMILAVMALTIAGCSYQGDTKNYDNSYTDNSVDYSDGTFLTCTDANCTVSGSSDRADADAVVGIFDADYGPAACRSAGYFYCDIENVCLNQPTTSGSCNR